jgi:hypothetical protein
MVEALQVLGYDTYFETELQDIPDFPYTTQGFERRRPDATLIQRQTTQNMINLSNDLTRPTKRQKIDNTNRKVIFLDFARTAGNTVDRLKENRDNKYQNQYRDLINSLTAQEIHNWTVEAHILNGSYAAAVDMIYWRTVLSSLGLSQPTIDKVIETAIFQLCEVYWDVEKTRLVALRTPIDKTSSHERIAVRPSSKGLAGCAP